MATEGVRAASAREIAALLHDAPLDEIEALAKRYGDDPRAQVRKAAAQALRRYEKQMGERQRVLDMYQLERELAGPGIALGVDEVGRGAIAGPLTVCAVALPSEPVIWGLNDSKRLTPQKREALAARIAEVALAIGIAHIEPASIDAVGMGSAIRMGMSQAIENAGIEPDAVLIDGNPVHVHPREKKVTRDAMMCAYAEDYPDYHLDACKGYGSAEHIEAVRALGCSPIHRVSFCGNFLETPRLF